MFLDLVNLGYYSDSQAFILKGIRIPNRLHTSINPRTFMRERLPSTIAYPLTSSREHRAACVAVLVAENGEF